MSYNLPTTLSHVPGGIEAKYASMPVPDVKLVDGVYRVRTDRQGALALYANSPWLVSGSSHHWHGTSNRATVFALAEQGWSEVTDAIVAQAEALEARKTRSLIPVMRYQDEPGTPDVAAYLTGEDEFFVASTEGTMDTPSVGRAIRFVIEPCVSALVEVDELVRRGATVAAMIYMLERSGVRTALEFGSATSVGQHDTYTEVILKDYGQPFDVSMLGYWLTHPAVARQIMFAPSCFPAKKYGLINWGNWRPKHDETVSVVPGFNTGRHDSLDAWMCETLQKTGIEVK